MSVTLTVWFPFRKTIDEFGFVFQPTVDRKLVDDLASLRFMDTGRPILFLGQPGCGTTHLSRQRRLTRSMIVRAERCEADHNRASSATSNGGNSSLDHLKAC